MRRRASPVTEISVSTPEISVTGIEIFPYEHFVPVTGTKKNSNAIKHFLIITAPLLDFLVQNNSL